MAKPYVQNASSEKQVKAAGAKVERRRNKELGDLQQVLARPEGRRVIWRILEHCQTFGSIWHASAAIHYNAGKQDVGHFIMSEIAESGNENLFQLMKENYNQGELDV